MLAQRNRFHGRGSIRKVFARGATTRGRYMMARFTPHAPQYPSRVAVVVSKKVYKSAVKRNRIRRRIYDIVRHRLADQKLSVDVVFTVLSGEVLVLSHADLCQEIDNLIARTPQPV